MGIIGAHNANPVPAPVRPALSQAELQAQCEAMAGTGLGWMAISVLLMFLIGYVGGIRLENRNPSLYIVLVSVILIFGSGSYWHILGIGDGVFSRDQISSFVLLIMFYIFGFIFGRRRRIIG